MYTNIFLFQLHKVNKMNTQAKLDYVNVPVNTSKGTKEKHYLNYKQVLNKALEANKENPKSVIHLLVPMGSGKTTFFKQLLTDIRTGSERTPTTSLNECIVFTNYFKSIKEYDEFNYPGLRVECLLDFAKEILNQVLFNKDHLVGSELCDEISLYVWKYYSYKVVLFDEVDFKDIQVVKSKGISDNACIIADDILINTVIGAITRVSNFNLSVSANVLRPSNYYSSYTIKLNVPVNNNINNFFVYDNFNKKTDNLLREISTLTHSITTNKDHLLGENAKCLIYTSEFDKRPFEQLILNGPRNGALVRTEDIPKTSYINPENHHNLMLINNANQLSDELFKEFDVVGINASASRCSSLKEQYENFWVVIIQAYGVTSSCLQALGRVRNCGINVLWIGEASNLETISKLSNEIDPFFNDYSGYDNTNFKYIDTLRCSYGIRGLNKSVSDVDDIVDDTNETTLKMNRLLIEWLEANKDNLKGSLKDYELYKTQMFSPCDREKFQECYSICKKGGSWS